MKIGDLFLLCNVTDKTIVSKVLANRLKVVLPELIDSDQTCSVPRRTILNNYHSHRNLVDHAFKRKQNSVSFEKNYH